MKLKLINKQNEARGTVSFFWKPEKPLSWLPGQYYYYTLPKLNYPDPRGDTRHFTISSSPTEGKLLRLTTRIREESGYKKTLNELPIGSTVEGDGPTGTFIFDENEKTKSHIFLAGGIGITPFRVFIKYSIDKNLKIPMHLIYSNSDSDFTFKEELSEWEKQNPNIKIDFIDSSKEGHLDENLIRKLVPSNYLLSSTYWLVGPSLFINAIEEVLEKLKVSSDNVHSEKFTGY